MGSTLTSRCHARRSTAPGRATVALRQAGKRTMLPKSFWSFASLVFLFRKNPIFYFTLFPSKCTALAGQRSYVGRHTFELSTHAPREQDGGAARDARQR
jgi:hypothetical protein